MIKWISIYFPLILLLGFSSQSFADATPLCLVDGNYFLQVTGYGNDLRSISGTVQTLNNQRENVNWWIYPAARPGYYRVSGYIGQYPINLDLIINLQVRGQMQIIGRFGRQDIFWNGMNGIFNGFQFCR